MKYALISDIHGNLASLTAVLKDAKDSNVDKYLFVGDYYGELPFPNETVNIIRNSPYVIRGNREDYLTALLHQDQTTWNDKQFAPLYWNYKHASKESLAYLTSLPKELIITNLDGAYIHMFHSPDHLFAHTILHEIDTENFTRKMEQSKLSRQELLRCFQDRLAKDQTLLARVDELPKGVYVFGHTHIQYAFKVGACLLINPGSCGIPLDFDAAASYTIIEHSASGWAVEERRVSYDIEKSIYDLENSSLYTVADVWSKIAVRELRTGISAVDSFLRLAEKISTETKDKARPYSDQVWDKASAIWLSKDRPF